MEFVVNLGATDGIELVIDSLETTVVVSGWDGWVVSGTLAVTAPGNGAEDMTYGVGDMSDGVGVTVVSMAPDVWGDAYEVFD
jgi:hypothetical protein